MKAFFNLGLASLMVLSLLSGVAVAKETSSSNATATVYRYIITETSMPTSLDPIEADSTQNLPVARMLYATPLEITTDNQLTSGILESFGYAPETRQIDWVVKKDLKFSDGSQLTADDVAFAVARMACTRPGFPVLEKIVGLHAWLKEKVPLKSYPSGIQVEGQRVSIRFTEKVRHPLFRFSLELFSIVPKKLVDPTSNKIQVSSIPSSGYYGLVERLPSALIFKRRSADSIQGQPAPVLIKFEYATPDQLHQRVVELDSNSIFAGNEQQFRPKEVSELQSRLAVKFLPAARFSGLLLNAKVAPFDSAACRLIFADEFRASFAEISGKDHVSEASLFTKLLPGYLSNSDLKNAAAVKPSAEQISHCRKKLEAAHLVWARQDSEADSLFVQAYLKTTEKLGMKKSAPLIAKDRAQLFDWFSTGKTSALSLGSGFWALDPAGDVKMLFTPNLHKPLAPLASDAQLQAMITELTDEEREKDFVQFNRYVHDTALLNVYGHLRRFYGSPNAELLRSPAFAISSPAPWQVFRVLP